VFSLNYQFIGDKAMVKSPRLLLIGTSLLLLSGIRCAQAGEIKIVSPSAYKDREGEGSVPPNCCGPFRVQQVFPAEDFAALGNQPHWLVDFTFRPDQSLTSPRNAYYPDHELRLATTPVGPDTLSLRFDDNLGSDFKHFHRGSLIMASDVNASGPGPREFYDPYYSTGLVTPYLYDPSQGNLVLDVIARQGISPSPLGDVVPGILSTLVGSPNATSGSRLEANVYQFTFIPVTPGDYNRDATVDAADYVVLRKALGTTYTQADYDAWRTNFGQTIGSGAALPSAEPLPIAVPEPVAWVMLLTGMLATFSRRSDLQPRPARACVELAAARRVLPIRSITTACFWR
jgi:hypothetical protein